MAGAFRLVYSKKIRGIGDIDRMMPAPPAPRAGGFFML